MNHKIEKLRDWRKQGYGPKARWNRVRRNQMKKPLLGESVDDCLFKSLKREAGELLEAGEVKKERELRATFMAEGKDLTHLYTFEDAVTKAGGRCVKVPTGRTTAADWHEQDPT